MDLQPGRRRIGRQEDRQLMYTRCWGVLVPVNLNLTGSRLHPTAIPQAVGSICAQIQPDTDFDG